MEYEGLAFCVMGKGEKLIEEGRNYVVGDVAINTKGVF
jgi:hypothetical protein